MYVPMEQRAPLAQYDFQEKKRNVRMALAKHYSAFFAGAPVEGLVEEAERELLALLVLEGTPRI